MSAGFIWGRHPVLEALRAGRATRVLMARGRAPSHILAEIRQEAESQGVTVQEVPSREIARLAPEHVTQGVAAEVRDRERLDLDGLLDSVSESVPFLLVLDQVQDPHNVGALLRTANAAGVQGLVIPDRRSAGVGGTVAKASAGAISHTPIVEVPNLARALDRLKEAGLWTVGLEGSARTSIYDTDLTMSLALVIGGEGSGLRRLTRERCDLLARLPMLGAVQSLNASVAGGVAIYEALRQRLRAQDGPGGVG